jgi:hypothetical protein
MLAAHSDLLERGLDLVERKAAAIGQGEARPQEDRRRWAVRPPSEESQTVEDGVNFTRPFRVEPVHHAHDHIL